MADLARKASKNPEFSDFVLERWPQCVDSAVEIDRALRPFFVYRPEYEEVVRSPEWMLSDLGAVGRLEGDCDDISTLVGAVALVSGYAARFTAIRYSPNVSWFEHVFTEVYDGDGWVTIDLTVFPGVGMHAREVMVEVL